jgi:3-hydroxyisobutyrate dehydrogenase-like beta-hydroxyacid dehydrogenase
MQNAYDPRRVAFIGFGEAGGILARGLAATGRHEVAVYDILLDDPERAEAMRAKARDFGVAERASAAEAAAGARFIFSAVTASSARDVARAAGEYLLPGQILIDINSISPDAKRQNAAAVERAGADYVEAAVMAPVPPQGMMVPILLGGRAASAVKAALDPAGMNLEVVGPVVGEASAIKMCRSIMIKGLEALTVECLLTARLYGVEDRIIASLDKSFPTMGWNDRAGYLIGRVLEHGRRRAAEMREVAGTVSETGLEPLMARAIAERQDWVADQVSGSPALAFADDKAWREHLDRLAELAGLRTPDRRE